MATRPPHPLVVIPWRPTPDRVAAFEHTCAWYAGQGFEVRTVDSDPDRRFNLAQARNRGVTEAQAEGYNVVIVSDADTFPDLLPLERAIRDAQEDGTVHLPYTQYRSLGAAGTARLHAGGLPEHSPHVVIPSACSGVLVANPATWWSIGGQDERFTCWGLEDVAYLVAHRTLLGRDFTRHEGNAYAQHHLDQPGKMHGPDYDAGVLLYQRYLEAADQGPQQLRDVLAR